MTQQYDYKGAVERIDDAGAASYEAGLQVAEDELKAAYAAGAGAIDERMARALGHALEALANSGARSWADAVLTSFEEPNEMHNLAWYRHAAGKLAEKVRATLAEVDAALGEV